MSVAAHQERLMTVIRGPHISEKTHQVAESNQVVFKVRTDATKDVVPVAGLHGKKRTFGWLKAVSSIFSAQTRADYSLG